MPKKRRAPGTACHFGKTCLAAHVIPRLDGEGPDYRLCVKHAADEIFAREVRVSLGGACWAYGRDKVHCNGMLQCCHRMSRRYLAVRWDLQNAVPMCAGHHVYYTYHPLEWEEVNRAAGVDWDFLRWRALNEPPQDPAVFLEARNVQKVAV